MGSAPGHGRETSGRPDRYGMEGGDVGAVLAGANRGPGAFSAVRALVSWAPLPGPESWACVG